MNATEMCQAASDIARLLDGANAAEVKLTLMIVLHAKEMDGLLVDPDRQHRFAADIDRDFLNKQFQKGCT